MKSNTYITKDLPSSGYLLTQGIEPYFTEMENGTCWFHFKNHDKCARHVSDYWEGVAMVCPKKFYEAVLSLKSRIFALKANVHEKNTKKNSR